MLIVTKFKGNIMTFNNFIKDCNLDLSLKMLHDPEAWFIQKILTSKIKKKEIFKILIRGGGGCGGGGGGGVVYM